MKENSVAHEGLYILDWGKLEVGDIILEHGYALHSSIICKATGSHYSHAMIYVGNTIIEATQKGRVFSKIPNRFTVKNINDLKVLRLKTPIPSVKMNKITEHARLLVGTEYGLKEAIFSARPSKNLKPTEAQFCSRLVAQSYASVGINLVANTNFCSPADIERSELLCEVPDTVREGTRQEIEHAHANSLHNEHRDSAADFCKNALEVLSLYKIKTITINNKPKKIATLNDIFRAVNERGKKIKTLDSKIAELMQTTGYMDGPFHDKQQNPYRYDIDLFTQRLNTFDEKIRIDILRGEIEKDLDHIEHRIRNFLSSKNNKKTKLKVFINDYEINKNMLETMLQRTLITLSYCSNQNSDNNIYESHISDLNEMKNKLESYLK
ncbi:TPA: hypothetical protein SMP82_001696 [Proteus mirabilis]|nr:hypothetical protein [Proteus mirabilis]